MGLTDPPAFTVPTDLREREAFRCEINNRWPRPSAIDVDVDFVPSPTGIATAHLDQVIRTMAKACSDYSTELMALIEQRGVQTQAWALAAARDALLSYWGRNREKARVIIFNSFSPTRGWDGPLFDALDQYFDSLNLVLMAPYEHGISKLEEKYLADSSDPSEWIAAYSGRNSKIAWRDYRASPGPHAKKLAFDASWAENSGSRGRGRPRKK